jgi:hypothetical protein
MLRASCVIKDTFASDWFDLKDIFGRDWIDFKDTFAWKGLKVSAVREKYLVPHGPWYTP